MYDGIMFSFVKHWFIPHSKNNHRAKILHNSSLLAIAILLFAVSFSLHFVKHTNPEVLGISYTINEDELLQDVNAARAQNGLPPLKQNAELADAARRKAADMYSKNYWAHFAPDGSTSPWGFIRDSGYSYKYAGENLAKGFTNSQSVVDAWMNSPSHRENLLSTNYQDVGFAIVPGSLEGEDTVLVVQMFGELPGAPIAKASDIEVPAQNTNIPLPTVSEAPAQQEVKSLAQAQPPVVDSKTASNSILVILFGLLLAGLAMDVLIVERRKIPRIVGHNLDHIMLILVFIVFMLVMEGGIVL